MFGTPQERAAALSAGVMVIFPTLLAGGAFSEPDRTQVAGSFRYEFTPHTQGNSAWVSPRKHPTSKRGGS